MGVKTTGTYVEVVTEVVYFSLEKFLLVSYGWSHLLLLICMS
jgi:hypothetical protein